jgi:hypothetical protein
MRKLTITKLNGKLLERTSFPKITTAKDTDDI